MLSFPNQQHSKYPYFPITSRVGIANNVAIPTIRFTKILFRQQSLGTAIDAPYLGKRQYQCFESYSNRTSQINQFISKARINIYIYKPDLHLSTSLKQRWETFLFTGTLFVMPLTPTPVASTELAMHKIQYLIRLTRHSSLIYR